MEQRKFFGYPQNVLVLSIVSFLNDIGGETIKRTIPLFLTNVLGVSTEIVGIVEGAGEATPQLLQPVSGFISDQLKKRKILVFFGQILRSSMVLLFFATGWIQVLVIRMLDRSGKGITGAPRDALVAASAEEGKKGKAFGFNRALDQAGSVVGLFAAGLITFSLWSNHLPLTRGMFQSIVLLTVVPFIIAIALIGLFVHDVGVGGILRRSSGQVRGIRENLSVFNFRTATGFWKFLLISFLFTLGNSSDGFLILRAQRQGLAVPAVFFLLAGMSLVAAFVNIKAGSWSDKVGRKVLLTAGWLLYGAIYLGFAFSQSVWLIVGLFIIYGAYYGLTEGVAKAFIADLIPDTRRATAFGIYNVTVGLTVFLASVMAGYLWQVFSPSLAFIFGAVMSLVAVGSLQLIFVKKAKVT